MPFVIALMGLPGCGKTTIAERLAREREFSIVSRDAIRAAMFAPCGFTEIEKQSSYRALLVALGACLALRRSCIVEGMPFSRASEIEDVRRAAGSAGAHFLPIMLDCPVEVAQARASRDVAAHGCDPADRDPRVVARVAERFAPPPPDALRLDATAPPEKIAAAIIARLDAMAVL